MNSFTKIDKSSKEKLISIFNNRLIMLDQPRGEDPLDKNKKGTLNNFRFYLPEGMYRRFPDTAQICGAIDQLLSTEFASLDAAQISARLNELQSKSVSTAMSYARAIRTPREAGLEQELRDVNSNLEEEYDKLRPLFNRLVAMGFDPADLIR